MNCVILGAGSGWPHPDFHSSSLMVAATDKHYLLDCGEGTSRQLLRHGFNSDFIDSVLISHYHPDHVSGLFMLLQLYYLEGRTKPLDLFLPEMPERFLEAMHMFYTFEQRFSFPLRVHEMQEAENLCPGLKVFPNDHLAGYHGFLKKSGYPNPMRSFSFAVEENGESLFYTSDLKTFHNLRPALDSADLIILDGQHPEAGLIIDFAGQAKGRIILTHGLSEAMRQWLQANPGHGIEMAREGKSYELRREGS